MYCDVLRISDLQLVPDCLTSVLVELTQCNDAELDSLWNDYVAWCASTSVLTLHTVCFSDLGIHPSYRAQRKFFTAKTLHAPNSYIKVSQKLLKGASARMMVFWITPILYKECLVDPSVHNTHLVCDL